LNPAFEDIQMVVATQGAVCALGSDQPYPPAGALAGLIRSIAAGSRFACRQVDMDSVDARSACLFAGELASERRDVQVAWRGDRRFIPSLVQIDPQQAPESEGIAEGGLYLLTGGLGGIGVHLSRFLLERYRACLIVTGRSELAAHPSRADAMHELEQLGGELTYRTADVTDLGAMRRIVESAERRCGRTLDGIFHLAGDIGMSDPWAERDGPESIDSLAAVFKPKAHGTETLAKIVAERPQTRLILFSSVSAVFGLGSFWGYSAANSFVDLVAARLRNRFGIRVQAIDWSMWEGVGMSALASSAAREAARALGYQTLSPAEALAALDFCLRTPLSRILVGLDSANPKIFALMRREAEPLEQVSIAASGTKWSADRIAFQDRFGTPVECILETDSGAPPTMLEEAPASETEQHVAAFIRDLLGVPRVNRRDSFFLLGGDSLAAMRLLNRIEQRWGVRVSLRQMAENPTAEGIAQAIEKHALSAPVSSNEAERLLENIDQLDDSQIEGLLARLASATS
jgi:NAD(P)-dependent dehydrogenase (short-subunit alcohol dehydrogenase family)/acyl carrier protein